MAHSFGLLRWCSRCPTSQHTQGYFRSALAAFETRTVYANSSGDHLVGWCVQWKAAWWRSGQRNESSPDGTDAGMLFPVWCRANSSLRHLEELPKVGLGGFLCTRGRPCGDGPPNLLMAPPTYRPPCLRTLLLLLLLQKQGLGKGVVREDPLEAAWWPDAALRVHTAPAAAQLRSGEARQVSEEDVMAADTPEELVQHSSSVASGSGPASRSSSSSSHSGGNGGRGRLVFEVPVAAGDVAHASTRLLALTGPAAAAMTDGDGLTTAVSSSSRATAVAVASTRVAVAPGMDSPEDAGLLPFDLYDRQYAAERPQHVEQVRQPRDPHVSALGALLGRGCGGGSAPCPRLLHSGCTAE